MNAGDKLATYTYAEKINVNEDMLLEMKRYLENVSRK
jgi:hypothetical protein